VRMLWGATALYMRVPDFLDGRIEILPGSPYPTYRLAIIAVGIAVGLLLYLLIAHTRTGMLIRAGAANRVMLGALGVNVRVLYTSVFALGAALAALAGVMAGPIFTVESGMGESVLISAFVVIVIGGIGSIRGAFVAALMVGIVDALGRAYLRPLLAAFMSRAAADNAAVEPPATGEFNGWAGLGPLESIPLGTVRLVPLPVGAIIRPAYRTWDNEPFFIVHEPTGVLAFSSKPLVDRRCVVAFDAPTDRFTCSVDGRTFAWTRRGSYLGPEPASDMRPMTVIVRDGSVWVAYSD